MAVGVIGLIVSTAVFATPRRPAGSRHRSYDRQVIDAQGRSTELHEEVR
jgi:hypothetical protein